jgi:hypothetical protein
MKYIFEYVGGTKGDMTVRFLNGVEPNMSFDQQHKTHPQILECENWLKLIKENDMTLERFEEVLSHNPYEYIPAHPLWCCCPTTLHGEENTLYSKYMDLLKEYNHEIISLKFEPKHYVTIFIERVLKNDYKHGIEINDPIRKLNSEFMKQLTLDEAFEGGPAEIFNRFNRGPARKKFNEMTNDRTLMYYDDLFLSDACPFPDYSHREDEWLMLVDQSWCDYDENGYRKFEVPEGICL